MPSKIKPIAIRFPNPDRAAIEALAAEDGTSFHAQVLALVRAGLEQRTHPANPAPSPRQVLAAAEAKAAHLGKPRRKWSV